MLMCCYHCVVLYMWQVIYQGIGVLCVCFYLFIFKILTRRLRFRLERAPGETALIDRTGRMLKMEPLATVESLEQYLLKMVHFFRGWVYLSHFIYCASVAF